MNPRIRNRLITPAVAALAAMGAANGAANAAEVASTAERDTVTVRVGDLDLASTAGASHAFSRLRNAAQAVCSDGDARRELFLMNEIRTCEQQALEPVVQQLKSPALAAIYDRRFRAHSAIVVEPLPG